MPGVFSKAARPKRPGAYFNWVADSPTIVLPGSGSIVAVPFTHDWGPFQAATLLTSFAEYLAVFGGSTDTPGYAAVKQAFQGEGLPGRGGAGAVLAYRTGGSAAAKAAKTLQNSTPAAAITLTARYEGSRGNDLKVTVQDHAADSTKDELLILDGSTVVETYVYTDTDINGGNTLSLVTQINRNSDWVTAAGLVTGVKLGNVSAQAFTAGNDGTTLVSGDWTDLMNALEIERFSLFAPFDLTDGSIVTALQTWAHNLNLNGKRLLTVVGGALGEDVSTAVARAQGLDDPDMVTVGIGTVTDDELGDLSTSQLAPRIAGVLAAKGETQSATFAALAGLTIKTGPTQAEILQAYDAGVLVLSRSENPNAKTRIEKALTTFTDIDDPVRPYRIYRQPKYVRTMHGIELELTEWAAENVIGQLQINDKTREFVVGEAKTRLDARVANGSLQPGFVLQIDQDPPPTDEDEFIALALGLKFGPSLEQLYFTVKIS